LTNAVPSFCLIGGYSGSNRSPESNVMNGFVTGLWWQGNMVPYYREYKRMRRKMEVC
jgi:hypothetical protein